MLSKNIDLYFFSGTGNTYLITREIEKNLKAKGYIVSVNRLEKTDPLKINLSHTIGLGVTAAYFFTYPIVWDFIRKLPKTNGTGFFFFDSLGGFSGGLLGPVKKEILSKGYTALGAEEFIMPSNFTDKKDNKSDFDKKYNLAKSKAETFVRQLENGTAKWKTLPVLGNLIALMGKSGRPSAFFRKKFPIKVDTSRCTQCGICYNACPADNIRMYEFPRFENNCQICMRCFSYCPVIAIYFEGMNRYPYKAVSIEELLLEKKD